MILDFLAISEFGVPAFLKLNCISDKWLCAFMLSVLAGTIDVTNFLMLGSSKSEGGSDR